MLTKGYTRRCLSELSFNPHKMASFEQLDFLEVTDLQRALDELTQSQLVIHQAENYGLNQFEYQKLIYQAFPFVKDLESKMSEIKDRIERVFIHNPFHDNHFDLMTGTVIIVTNYDQKRLISAVLNDYIQAQHYQLEIYKSDELMPHVNFENDLEVLNW